MTDLVIETTEGLRLRQEVAGAGSRAAAGIIDLLVCLVSIFVLTMVAFIIAATDPTGASGFVYGIFAGGVPALLILYQVVSGITGGGRTLGKRLLGIRVADVHGSSATAVQHILRGLFWPVEVFLMIPLPVGIVVIALTRMHQRLGDLVAGTIVLRDVKVPTVPDPYPRDTWSGLPDKILPLAPAHAERLDGEDLAFLRDLLARHGLDAGPRAHLFVKSALHYGQKLGFGKPQREFSPRKAHAILREIYLFLRETRGAYSSSR